MSETVVILGCGYVGLELGRQLQSTGVETVVGVRRSERGVEEGAAAGLEPVRGDLKDEKTLEALPDADVVVWTASAGRDADSTRATYIEGQRTVLDHFGRRNNPPDRYIYTSSTGVYGDHGGNWVDEETALRPTTERMRVRADSERTALDRARENGIDGTVVRLAGLYGPGRYRLERYLEGPVTEGVLNLIHRDDAAGAMAFLLGEGRGRNDVVLAVDDEPVSKWELADWLAEQCDRPAPPKQTKEERLAADSLSESASRRILTEKRCRNDRLKSFGYSLRYPTFRDGYRDAIEAYNDR